MGTIIGTVASIVVGGIVATATIVGVVSSQTGASGDSPANVNSPVIAYGSK
jgi:hypothetical protein